MEFKIKPLEIKFEGKGSNLLGKAESMNVLKYTIDLDGTITLAEEWGK